MFKDETYLESSSQHGEQDLNLGSFQNIERSCFHKVASKLALMPYVEIVPWLISRIDAENKLIKDKNEKAITSF